MENAAKNSDIYILIVEDDWFAQNICTSALYRLGYRNIENANNGHAALEMMDNAERPFSLIILDLNMPEMNGIDFIQKLSDLQFPGALIIVSGEDEDLLEAAHDLADQTGISILDAIPKPINVEHLAQLLLKVTNVQATKSNGNA